MSCNEKEEFYQIIHDILMNEEFQKRKTYKHHGDITVYEHSLKVSKVAYKMAKKFHKDYKSAAIGGLLHDFYDKPWQEDIEKKPFFQRHGFVHAKQAMINANKYFPDLVNKKIDNIILRHMFPLNKVPPKYIESWFVTLADKYVSLEVFLQPTKLPMLFGFRKKKKGE